jgi:alkyl hydroperoxide reductase subunit AhpC
MVRIGKKVPSFRVPALTEDGLRYVTLGRFKDRWVLLCFLPLLTRTEAVFLQHQPSFPTFASNEASLIAVSPDPALFYECWTRQMKSSGLVLFIDPLHRLHRAFGIKPRAVMRCQSFVIDPEGMLQFLMVHDLKGDGISALSEILNAGLTWHDGTTVR